MNLCSQIDGYPLAIYGYGNSFRFFSNIVLKPLEIKIKYFIDKKFSKCNRLNGALAVPLKDLKRVIPLETVIIITVGDANESISIRKKLNEIGYGKVIYFQEIYEYNLVYGSKKRTNQYKEFFEANNELIEEIRHYLADRESLQLFDAIIKTHKNSKLEKFPWKSVKFQYFNKKLFRKGAYDRLLQIGAFDGDTLQCLDSCGVKPDTLWAFEPDKKNFLNLKKNIPLAWKGQQINLIQMAVGNRSGEISFVQNNGPTSRIGKGTSFVKSVKLDDYHFQEDPTIVILDVEGYERQAISGMKKLIRRCLPTIAVATYHFPSDILKIPKLIMEISPYKNVLLRNYSGSVVDTVMYFHN